MEEEELTAALKSISYALHQLGTGNAATQMGAIEALAVSIKEGCADIADAIRSVSDSLESEPSEKD